MQKDNTKRALVFTPVALFPFNIDYMRVTAIVKVSNTKFIKYNVTNLMLFERFLDRMFTGWRYYNYFDKETKKQIGSYTSKNRYSHKYS